MLHFNNNVDGFKKSVDIIPGLQQQQQSQPFETCGIPNERPNNNNKTVVVVDNQDFCYERTIPPHCPKYCFTSNKEALQRSITDLDLITCNTLKCYYGLPGRNGGKPIEFIHVPKTGGSSVEITIKKIASLYNVKRQKNNLWITESDSCIITGHRPLRFDFNFNFRNPLKVIIFRNPVDFAVSFFDFVMFSKNKYYEQKNNNNITKSNTIFNNSNLNENIISKNKMLMSFVHDKQSAFLFWSYLNHNGECDLALTNQYQYQENRSSSSKTISSDLFSEKWYSDEPMGGSISCSLLLLETIDLVGITEKLDDLLIQLQYKTNWIVPNQNKFEYFNKLDNNLKSIITKENRNILIEESKNGMDLRVYERAVIISNEKTLHAKKCLNQDQDGVLDDVSSAHLEPPPSLDVLSSFINDDGRTAKNKTTTKLSAKRHLRRRHGNGERRK